MRVVLLSLAIASLMLSGCGSKNPQTAAAPALAPPVTALPDAEPSASSTNDTESAATELTLDHERVVVPPLRPATPLPSEHESAQPATASPAPTPSRKPDRRPASSQNARTGGTEAAADTETTRTEARPPSLKPMLSDTDRRQLLAQTDGNLERARRNIALVQVNRLDQNEVSALAEARSFVARAEQLRESDPVLANSLAERAAILSQEVLRKQR